MSQKSLLDFFPKNQGKKQRLDDENIVLKNQNVGTTQESSTSETPSESLPIPMEPSQGTRPEIKPPESEEKFYKQKFRTAWLSEFKGWLEAVPSNPFKAHCNKCHVNMKAHRATIVKHSKTVEHLDCVRSEGVIVPIQIFSNSIQDQKRAELQLAVHIAEHASIQSVDHLSEFLARNHPESSTLAHLRLHRTKCTKLITEVLAPSLHAELVEDVISSASCYSLIVDESTDTSSQKCLCIVIRYYSTQHQAVVSPLYCLLKIEQGDATTQVNAIKKQLEVDCLPLEKLIGIGVDGASVNVGVHHSVSSLLKQDLPNLVTFRCVCHSLHLAASKAMDTFPRCLDFLVRESCCWFTHSTKRQVDYQYLYGALCDGKMPQKIGKFSETRWLSRHEIVKKILDQWDALTLHFEISRHKERCYTAEQLFSMYSDPINKAYLSFLSAELEGICKLNRSFQAENIDVTKLLNDLQDYYMSILQRIVHLSVFRSISKANLLKFDITSSLIPPSALHLGYTAHLILDTAGINKQTQDQIKEVCFRFIKELAVQIRTRLPDNLTILKNLEMLSPPLATSQPRPLISSLASQFPKIAPNIDQLEREWNILPTKIWTSAKDTIKFWVEVFNTENADGEKKFFNIGYFALSLLSLPFSNAVVERAFSQMNAVKSKLRNRLSVKTVNAVLQTRYGLTWRKEDCRTFVVTEKMLKLFKSSIYEPKTEEVQHESDLAAADEVVGVLNALDHV